MHQDKKNQNLTIFYERKKYAEITWSGLRYFILRIQDFLKLWRDHAGRKHELAILDRQMEAGRQGHTQRLEETKVQARRSMLMRTA